MIEDFQDLDIYVDVHPFVETAVKLTQRPNKPKADTYINANYIKSAYNEYPNDLNKSLIIATQGPKTNTVEAFWRMVN